MNDIVARICHLRNQEQITPNTRCSTSVKPGFCGWKVGLFQTAIFVNPEEPDFSGETRQCHAKVGLYLKVGFFLISSHKIGKKPTFNFYFWKIINIMHLCDLQRQSLPQRSRHGLSREFWVKERLYIALQTLGDHQKILPKRQSRDGMLLKESIARDNGIFNLSNIVFRVKI